MDLSQYIPFFGIISAFLMNVLPSSPLRLYIENFQDIPWLSYLNWFLPVPEMIAIFQTWLMCYGTFVAYKALMRFIRIL